jgi:hypothetical protein
MPQNPIHYMSGQTSGSDLQTIFTEAQNGFGTWSDAATDPAIVDIDLDLLSSEVWCRRVKYLYTKPSNMTETACSLCDEDFEFADAVSTGRQQATNRTPVRLLCKQQLCMDYFERWRLQGTGGCFTCPQCRRCIACGRSDCPIHIL